MIDFRKDITEYKIVIWFLKKLLIYEFILRLYFTYKSKSASQVTKMKVLWH